MINKRNLKRKIQPIPVDMVECGINTEEKVIWKTSVKKKYIYICKEIINFRRGRWGGDNKLYTVFIIP